MSSLFITKNGTVYSCGWGADGQTGLGHYNNEYRPTIVEGDIKGEKIIKVVSSADCVLALNGKLFFILTLIINFDTVNMIIDNR